MNIALGVVSKRPLVLQENLPKYIKQMEEVGGEWAIIIVDDDSTFNQNERFLKNLEKDYIKVYHACNKKIKTLVEKLRNEVDFNIHNLFYGTLGGARNVALLLSFLLKQHLIFVDDDTIPEQNFLLRYINLFKRDYLLIGGRYIGNTPVNSVASLLEFIHALEKCANIDIKNHKLIRKIECSLMAIPPQRNTIILHTFVGGNCGINNDLLKKYCFFPTNYRVEDFLYWKTVTHFIENALYFPSTYDEAYTTLPIVRHKITENRTKQQLYTQLTNELRGSVIVKIIIKLFLTQQEQNKCFYMPDSQTLKKLINDAVEETWYDFGMRIHKKNLEECYKVIEKINDNEIKAEYEKIMNIQKENISILPSEAKNEINKFVYCLTTWPKIIKTIEKEGCADVQFLCEDI